MKFDKIGKEKKFKVVVKANGVGVPKDYVFGELILSNGKHSVRSPLVVKAKQT